MSEMISNGEIKRKTYLKLFIFTVFGITSERTSLALLILKLSPEDLDLESSDPDVPELLLILQIFGRAQTVPRKGIKLVVRSITLQRMPHCDELELEDELELFNLSLRKETTIGPYLS